MANQMRSISGNNRLRRNQIAELNARMASLPDINKAKLRKEEIGRQKVMNDAQRAQWDRSYNLAKKQAKFQKKQGRTAMGLQAAGLGLNLMDAFGDKSSGGMKGFGGFKGLGIGNPGSYGGTNIMGKQGGGLLSNINFGKGLGGALTGYGLGTAAGGKTGGYVGAGLGALLSSGLGGSLMSGLGGLF